MQRFLLLIVLVVWLAGDAAPPVPLAIDPRARLMLFIGGFALIVLIPALWSRVLARYVAINNLHKSLSRFSWGTQIARMLIPAWFSVGVFALGWTDFVYKALGPIAHWPVELPAAIVGTLPAMLAWMAMWWASYPAERALREQSLLLQLQDGLPLHSPPGFWSYFSANVRMQLLFTVIPVALVLLIRDIVGVALSFGFGIDLLAAKLTPATATETAKTIQWVIMPLSMLVVFIFAPEILRRVLQTQPLPDSALRRRLEEMCRRSGLRYRDILLWRTNGSMGNAAVMGVVPQVRYILLTDVLLETMTDQQVEAVFAHEAGHVVHRHLLWFGAFWFIAIAAQLLIAKLAETFDVKLAFMPTWLRDPIILAGVVGAMVAVLGVLSRWFERQADVYAARTMQRELVFGEDVRASDLPAEYETTFVPELASSPAPVSAQVDNNFYVGQRGAALFASALRRVAVVNNIPMAARNFSHGSIAARVSYLQHLSAHPKHTARFDRSMRATFIALSAALAASIVCVAVLIWRG